LFLAVLWDAFFVLAFFFGAARFLAATLFATFFFVRELDFLASRDVGGSKFKLKLSSIAGGACGGRFIARSGGRA
jgi:hypothetical protein